MLTFKTHDIDRYLGHNENGDLYGAIHAQNSLRALQKVLVENNFGVISAFMVNCCILASLHPPKKVPMAKKQIFLHFHIMLREGE